MNHLNSEFLKPVENPDDTHLYGWYVEAAITLINKTGLPENQHEDIFDYVLEDVRAYGAKSRENAVKNYGNYSYLRKIVQHAIAKNFGSSRGMERQEYALYVKMQQFSEARQIPWDEEHAYLYARCLGVRMSAVYTILQIPPLVELMDNNELLGSATPAWE